MHFISKGKNKHGYNIKHIFLTFVILLITSLLLSFMLLDYWKVYTGLLHTIMESICIFIAISSFLIVLLTYNKNTNTSCIIIGFGFLCVAVFDIFHIGFFLGFSLYPPENSDIAARYWVLGRFTEAVLIFLSVSNISKRRFNKWVGTAIVLALSLGISYCMQKPDMLPQLCTVDGPTSYKVLIECIIILVFIADFFLILRYKSYSYKDIIAFKYILAYILLVIPTELLFSLSGDTNSYCNILGHIQKVAFYCLIFKGVYISVVEYPYAKLEERNAYMYDVLDHLPDGLAIYDGENRLKYINNTALGIIGYSFEDVKRKDVIQIIQMLKIRKTGYEPLKPQDVPELQKPIKNRLASIVDSKGTTVKIRYNAYKLENGEYLISFNRANIEQQLEDLQIQTQTIINSMSNLALVIDKDDTITMCNNAMKEEVGIDISEIIGMKLNDFREKIQFEVKTVLQENAGFSVYEVSIISATGKKKDVILNSSNIYNFDGDLIGYINISSDITDFKRELRKHQHQEKLALIGQIASGIVHEIKSPLTIIKGISQLIKMRYDDPKLQQYIKSIEDASNSINKFITSILDLAKPHPNEIAELSLNGIIQEIALILKDYLSIKGIIISTVLCDGERAVMGDADKIKQVLLNIINNAVDAVSGVENPRISIITIHDDERDRMVVKIIDNGEGISGDDMNKIGTPFFTTKSNGTGLGLSICYQIINQHGGRIIVESEEKKGTCFIISLPCRYTVEHHLNLRRYDGAVKEM